MQLVTLDEAIGVVRDGLTEGVDCPCCGQYAKMYKRALNSGMTSSLLWLVQQSMVSDDPYGWVNVGETAPAWLLRTKELATTRHWGLIERREKDSLEEGEEGDAGVDAGGKRTSGIWRPLPLGVEFAYDRTDVPRHVFLYNNVCAGFSEERVRLQEALADRFNYREMMSSRERPLRVLAPRVVPVTELPPPLRKFKPTASTAPAAPPSGSPLGKIRVKSSPRPA